MAVPKTLPRKVPVDLVKRVEDQQLPRETFGEALVRYIEEAKQRRGTGQEAQRKAS